MLNLEVMEGLTGIETHGTVEIIRWV